MKIVVFVSLLFAFSGKLNGQKRSFGGPVILQSRDLLVKIDRTSGLPFQYLYRNSPIRGVDSAHLLNIVVCRLQPRSYIKMAVCTHRYPRDGRGSGRKV